MMTNPGSCFGNSSQSLQVEGAMDSMLSSQSAAMDATPASSLICNLSLLTEKVHQLQSMVNGLILPDQGPPESAAMAVASMGTLIQEVIVTASSMMFACQKLALEAANPHTQLTEVRQQPPFIGQEEADRSFFSIDRGEEEAEEDPLHNPVSENCDIVELDAADLLAKYTHYCQVCGKGFKRDANLRMHMRAHGDQYKSTAALSNPSKGYMQQYSKEYMGSTRKYSCPQEGCRWNKKHEKFQPLKSMICVKNHYKRSHCPKMYVCNRCNRKQFSLLSDLRTHEKHCGDLKWQCSCGTTFSRKDKLMNHLALFAGHSPVAGSFPEQG